LRKIFARSATGFLASNIFQLQMLFGKNIKLNRVFKAELPDWFLAAFYDNKILRFWNQKAIEEQKLTFIRFDQ